MNILEVRQLLADAVDSVVDDSVTVYPSAVDGVARFPAVVVGMPSWKPGPTSCLNRYEFPVAVIVSRPALADDAATVAELDALWPSVLSGLQAVEGPDLALSRAEFGLFSIGGQQYPSQTIFVSLLNSD